MANPFFVGGPLNESRYTPDFLKWEEDGHFSREVTSITAGGTAITLPAGTVLENVSAGVDKEFDGTGDTINGILFDGVYIPAGQTLKVTVIRRMAVVDGRYLVATGITNANVLARFAASLLVAGMVKDILVRSGA